MFTVGGVGQFAKVNSVFYLGASSMIIIRNDHSFNFVSLEFLDSVSVCRLTATVLKFGSVRLRSQYVSE